MACSDKNMLTREGTGRYNRRLEALSPLYVQVDERSTQDMLLFIKRYAPYINYFGTDNTMDGTWEALVQRDVSMVLSVLAAIDPISISDYQKLLYKRIWLAVKDGNENEAKRQFKYIFDLVYTMVKIIDEQCQHLQNEMDYQQEIEEVISRKMNRPYTRLDSFRKQHASLLIDTAETDPTAPFPTLNSSSPIPFHYFKDTGDVLNMTIPNIDTLSKIKYVIQHNLFDAQVKALFAGVSAVTRQSEDLLQQSLTHHAKHEPHMALLLSFLHVFKHAQDSLNTYGKRHLDHYYKNILRLKNKAAEPDNAFLVFGLQKHVDQHVLTQGTLFKGGKDDAGNAREYRLTDDVVLTKAAVAKINAIRKSKGALFALEDSNIPSPDAPVSHDNSWFAFGDGTTAPTPDVGFAIASNLLFLAEGERRIEISIRFQTALKSAVLMKPGDAVAAFKIWLTGEKGWVAVEALTAYNEAKRTLSLSIELDMNMESIVPYTEKIHQKGISSGLPMLLACFDQQHSPVTYDALSSNKVATMTIQVGVTGAKDLALSNDVGMLDNGKPFKPFGDFPRSGAGFYVGSKEIFQKDLSSLALVSDIPDEFTVQYLHKGKWLNVAKSKTDNAYALSPKGKLPLFKATAMDFGNNVPYNKAAKEGFIRLQLNNNKYSLQAYTSALNDSMNRVELRRFANVDAELRRKTAGAISQEKLMMSSAGNDIQNRLEIADRALLEHEGYRMAGFSTPTPLEFVVNLFSINYTAAATLDFVGNGSRHHYYHIHPFGHERVARATPTLLPETAHAGELLIGLTDAKSPTTVTMLFELAEGSSNPLKNMEHVSWYYLDKHNNWQLFEEASLIDGTVNLTRTGIVTATFPPHAGREGTVMPTGMLWMKACVSQHTDAVCKVLDIRAQAGKVELVQDENNGIVFRQTLPKDTIAKLQTSDSAVKTIEQPADSQHGRMVESDEHFYTRVSERLRHKQRAISIWDYEHMVLEKFPEIYKVKCINRAGFVDKDGQQVFCENYPGHVTIIPIPDLNNKYSTNPLRPYTPIGLLADIATHLDQFRNPFVTLHVKNPQFEEVQLQFDVKFHENSDEKFYLNQLNDDIERFLCPWAFGNGEQLSFGGKIAKSTLINFIDERPYVAVVSAFKLHHIIHNEWNHTKTITYDVDEAVASSARSALVSHDKSGVKHLINVIQNCTCI
ncbi:baseplate J/gp47 family protein [Parapedobacter tibetensis]|uniref:baseplate J/gp47 family protein n=1 Tax=Parapedobacter tibetensis TaxID=2972951 RepID=UPI00214DA167|nr:baseplate J/gp47 family protein [Parapedobacter tibetensis]